MVYLRGKSRKGQRGTEYTPVESSVWHQHSVTVEKTDYSPSASAGVCSALFEEGFGTMQKKNKETKQRSIFTCQV